MAIFICIYCYWSGRKNEKCLCIESMGHWLLIIYLCIYTLLLFVWYLNLTKINAPAYKCHLISLLWLNYQIKLLLFEVRKILAFNFFIQYLVSIQSLFISFDKSHSLSLTLCVFLWFLFDSKFGEWILEKVWRQTMWGGTHKMCDDKIGEIQVIKLELIEIWCWLLMHNAHCTHILHTGSVKCVENSNKIDDNKIIRLKSHIVSVRRRTIYSLYSFAIRSLLNARIWLNHVFIWLFNGSNSIREPNWEWLMNWNNRKNLKWEVSSCALREKALHKS